MGWDEKMILYIIPKSQEKMVSALTNRSLTNFLRPQQAWSLPTNEQPLLRYNYLLSVCACHCIRYSFKYLS